MVGEAFMSSWTLRPLCTTFRAKRSRTPLTVYRSWRSPLLLVHTSGTYLLAFDTVVSILANGENKRRSRPTVQGRTGRLVAGKGRLDLARIHRRDEVTAAEWAMRGKGRRWSGRDFG